MGFFGIDWRFNFLLQHGNIHDIIGGGTSLSIASEKIIFIFALSNLYASSMLLGYITLNCYLTPRDTFLLSSRLFIIHFNFLKFFVYQLDHFQMDFSVSLFLISYLARVTGSYFLIICIGTQVSSSWPSHDIRTLGLPFRDFSFYYQWYLISSKFERS